MLLPRYQTKKYRNRRSVVQSMLYCSHLALKFCRASPRAHELIKDYYSFKTEQIALINLYNERLAAEKNEFLMDFYNRSIVHNIMKVQFIRHMFDVFLALGHKDNLVLLNRKLLKLIKTNEPKPEKDKNNKKDPSSMDVENEGPKEMSMKEHITKETPPRDLESTTFFNLFC